MTPAWKSDCGTVGLFLGDCLPVLQSMADQSIDVLLTDPPYGIQAAIVLTALRKRNQKMSYSEQDLNNRTSVYSMRWVLGAGFARAGNNNTKFPKPYRGKFSNAHVFGMKFVDDEMSIAEALSIFCQRSIHSLCRSRAIDWNALHPVSLSKAVLEGNNDISVAAGITSRARIMRPTSDKAETKVAEMAVVVHPIDALNALIGLLTRHKEMCQKADQWRVIDEQKVFHTDKQFFNRVVGSRVWDRARLEVGPGVIDRFVRYSNRNSCERLRVTLEADGRYFWFAVPGMYPQAEYLAGDYVHDGVIVPPAQMEGLDYVNFCEIER